MGGRQSKHSSRLNQRDWVVIRPDQNALFTNVNSYANRGLRNIHTQQQIQEYHIEFLSQTEYLQYVRDLRMRKDPSAGEIQGESNSESYYSRSPYIYTVKYFVNDSMEDMCSTTYKGLLYVQKVDLRLKEINDIPLKDQLYLTKATLEGFKVLYQKTGYFDICEEMIFIGKNGKVKVWLHPNLSKNQPYLIPTSLQEPHGSQAEMIVKLLDIIEENTDIYSQGTLHFRQYLKNKNIYNRLSFYKALEQFQLYCAYLDESMVVEECMNSIYQLYHPDQMELNDDQSQQISVQPHQRMIFNVSGPNSSQQPIQTPIKRQELIEDVLSTKKIQASNNISNSLYNSQAIKSYRQNDIPARPAYQSVQKNRAPPPTFRGVNPPIQASFGKNSTFPSQKISQHQINIPAPKMVPPPSEISFNAPPRQTVFTFKALPGSNVIPQGPVMSNNLIRSGSGQKRSSNLIKFNYSSKKSSGPQQFQVPLVHRNPLPQRPLIGNPILIQRQQPKPVINTQKIVFATYQQSSLPKAVQVAQATQPTLYNIGNNVTTVKTINTESNQSGRQTLENRKESKKVSYYSAHEEYNLDTEIAEDLQNFLGYNARS